MPRVCVPVLVLTLPMNVTELCVTLSSISTASEEARAREYLWFRIHQIESVIIENCTIKHFFSLFSHLIFFYSTNSIMKHRDRHFCVLFSCLCSVWASNDDEFNRFLLLRTNLPTMSDEQDTATLKCIVQHQHDVVRMLSVEWVGFLSRLAYL